MAAVAYERCRICGNEIIIGIENEDYIDNTAKYELVCHFCKGNLIISGIRAFDIVDKLPEDCILARKIEK